MDEKREGRQTRNEKLRELRAARKESIRALSGKVKEQTKIIDSIRELLGEGPRTVPETATALGLPTSEIMWYFAALKKYGEIVEGEKAGGCFRYGPANGTVRDNGGKG